MVSTTSELHLEAQSAIVAIALAGETEGGAGIAGLILGTGAVTQIGGGTTILTADNSSPGGTTVSQDTLQVGNGGTPSTIAGNVTNNGALAFSRNDGVTISGTTSGAGAVN